MISMMTNYTARALDWPDLCQPILRIRGPGPSWEKWLECYIKTGEMEWRTLYQGTTLTHHAKLCDKMYAGNGFYHTSRQKHADRKYHWWSKRGIRRYGWDRNRDTSLRQCRETIIWRPLATSNKRGTPQHNQRIKREKFERPNKTESNSSEEKGKT